MERFHSFAPSLPVRRLETGGGGGGGREDGLPYKKARDARRKIRISLLRESNVDVARASLDP